MKNEIPHLGRAEILTINQKGWDQVAPKFYGGTALPKYGPLAVTEDDIGLIENLKDKTVLELGCGSGHTLSYLWKQKDAAELWGLDLSQEQIRFAQECLGSENIPVNLFQAAMDENPGIPEAYFDLVISIYALGWTANLQGTLAQVYSYLKPGGVFIFSWEHPAYHCLSYREDIGQYVFTRPYLQEGPEHNPSWKGVEIVMHPRALSTYVNAVVESGLVLEKLIESEQNIKLAREQDHAPAGWYSVPRSALVPTTFIVKAHKPA
jgi:SAM-dependent methyltransferase